jgi:hypothetical protein
MRAPIGVPPGIIVVLSIFTFFSPVLAQQQYTLTPSLSVSETYDDNIYLDPQNEISDYITAISPGISLDVRSPRSDLLLTYVPSIVRYSRETENDTVRHLGRLTYRQDIQERFRFDFTNTYIRSEEPLETTEGIETVRRTRNPYQRNTGEARMSYQFGREDTVTAGYRNDLLINEDPTLEDGTIHEPFADFVKWFDQRHGVGLSYRYSVGDFDREDGLRSQQDYTGHSPAIRYMHRVSPRLSGYLSYAYTTREFDKPTFREDYDVHTAMIGVEKQFGPQTSVTAGLGYFVQEPERSESQSGISYNASLRKAYQRGSFLIGGAGGWDEQYLEAENRGFVEFWSIEASGEYRFLERVTGYARALYREDTYSQTDIETQTLRASAGIRWNFYRYLSIALDYTHGTRDSDDPTDEYKANRFMVILSGSKPYVWQ